MAQGKLKLKTNKWIIKKFKYFEYKQQQWYKFLATKCHIENKICLKNLRLYGEQSRYCRHKIRQLELLKIRNSQLI